MTRGAILAVLALQSVLPAAAQPVVLIEEGTPMKYLANTADPGIAPLDWVLPSYADAGWGDGVYGVGYENGSGAAALITTAVPSNSASVYTRSTFVIADVNQVSTLSLGVDRDDGYIAWINGVEVARSGVLGASPAWNTPALPHESSDAPDPVYTPRIDISEAAVPALHDGTNVLAIGVWNTALPSSDLVLVPQLTMNLPGPAPRGPYLQNGRPDSIVVRWRTSDLEDSVVRYGPAPDQLDATVSDPAPRMNHEIILSGLAPDTLHYYSVGSSSGVIAGGDEGHRFRSAPPLGSRAPIRIWAIGDSGTGNQNARAVWNAYEEFSAGTHTDVWLMLGDNAYEAGTDDDYQAAVFETYPDRLARTPLYPTLGNHDGASSFSSGPTGPYYDSFTLPVGMEGGTPSGTEAYYSFDFANVHFVCLNSEDVDRSPGGDMLLWLEADLMNTAQDWIIAFWHHPPYTKGSHDSDNDADSGGRMRDMRENVLPILEAWGVDLVLTGHSHSYERSYLLDGHYDVSGTLDPSMILDGGDGRIDGDGAYQKASSGPAAHEGAVYVVAGSSGKVGGGSLDHPAMFIGISQLGSLALDVEGDRLQGWFLDPALPPSVKDHFTLVKGTSSPPTAGFAAAPDRGVAPLSVQFADRSTTNTAAWAWDLDGDDITDRGEPSPRFTYVTPGSYTVRLTASNASGSGTESRRDAVCVAGSLPAAVANLAFLDAASLAWDATAGALAYDLVRGDLGSLAAAGGDFAAAGVACLADGTVDPTHDDGAVPAPGMIRFYLARGQGSCDLPGTFDSPGALASRDTGIAAAAGACP